MQQSKKHSFNKMKLTFPCETKTMSQHWYLISLFIFSFVSLSTEEIDGGSEINAINFNAKFCRFRGDLFPSKTFSALTCQGCYQYMPYDQFKLVDQRPLKWRPDKLSQSQGQGQQGQLGFLTNGSLKIQADWRVTEIDLEDEDWKTFETPETVDATVTFLDAFIDDVAIELWRDCCKAAENCCDDIGVSSTEAITNNGLAAPSAAALSCPPTWDGWQCWRQGGQPSGMEYAPCPGYIFFNTGGGLMQNTCGNYAEKYCNSSGEWLKLPGRGEWTDFTTCSRVNALLSQEYVHLGMYAMSIVALVPALSIFFAYKVLKVQRIAIHKNLFASLLAHCILMIIFKSWVLLPYINKTTVGQTLLEKNGGGCRLLVMLSKYFRLTNYTWMFCEGYYLHRLLANTFEEERSLLVILSIGWGVPLIPCLVYGILRIYVDNSLCWALPVESQEWLEWVYMIPGLLCILANVVFFVNIFRILFSKLQAPHANEPAHFRKAVHATVVLLPLFGLHWLLTLYRPQIGSNCIWQTGYKYLNICLDGLQGLMVAIAFCYRNGEITTLICRSVETFRLKHNLGSGSPNNHQRNFNSHHSQHYTLGNGLNRNQQNPPASSALINQSSSLQNPQQKSSIDGRSSTTPLLVNNQNGKNNNPQNQNPTTKTEIIGERV